MRVVEAPHTVVTGCDAEGAPVARRVVMGSTAIVSTQGPSVRALAAAWGEELLRMLWAPARVPGELAEAVARGWAEAAPRAAWEARRGALRDRAVEAWAGVYGIRSPYPSSTPAAPIPCPASVLARDRVCKAERHVVQYRCSGSSARCPGASRRRRPTATR